MTKGWKCPVCGEGIAPWVSKCDHDLPHPVDAPESESLEQPSPLRNVPSVTTNGAYEKPVRTPYIHNN